MPKFGANPNGTVPSQFGFTAVDLDTLGASEYTLVGLTVDSSGSVAGFARDEEKAITEVVKACRKSPRADNLMLRFTRFDSNLTEVHGFKLLQDCDPASYAGSIPASGYTALYDASIDAVDAMARYGRDLHDHDYTANAVLFVITDGGNNTGLNMSPGSVGAAIKTARMSENLESITPILIGVNVRDPNLNHLLTTFAQEAGFSPVPRLDPATGKQAVDASGALLFDPYLCLDQADAKTLARLAQFVVGSISSVSQSLGTGGLSQQIPTF